MSGIFAAKAIVAYGGRMALILRDNNPQISSPNMWDAPGGLVEKDESPEKAIKRELIEEVCVAPGHIEEVGKIAHPEGSTIHRFFVRLSDDEYKKVKLGDEGQRLEWFTYNEAVALELTPRIRLYLEEREEDVKEFLRRSL